MGRKKRRVKKASAQVESSRKRSSQFVERIWRCPVSKISEEGFFVERRNGKYFLGWEDKEKQLKVLISREVFEVLKREWSKYD